MALAERVTFGSKQYSAKGEDFSACATEGSRGAFAVFDSHGGKDAGALCKAELFGQLLSLAASDVAGHDAFREPDIVDAFWTMDHRLGSAGIYSGTTASVLLVSHNADSLCCTLAWVGDSTALTIDMTSQVSAPPPQQKTSDHTPANPAEAQRCIKEWEVRREVQSLRNSTRLEDVDVEPPPNPTLLQQAAGFFGNNESTTDVSAESFVLLKDHSPTFYAKKRAPTRDEIMAAIDAAGLEASEDERELLARALLREKRVEAPEKRASFVLGREGTRKNTKIITRNGMMSGADGSVTLGGPHVLAGGDDGAVSTCVTRSIGDWDGARAMVPQPEVLRFEVGRDQHVRAIIASDGVWDFLSLEEAAALARKAPTAQVAAQRIADKARARSLSRLNQLKDDTTCVVVDLNPSGLEVTKPPPPEGGGGCCVLS